MTVDRANNNFTEITQIADCDVVQSYIYLRTLISNNGGNNGKNNGRSKVTYTHSQNCDGQAEENMEEPKRNESYEDPARPKICFYILRGRGFYDKSRK